MDASFVGRCDLYTVLTGNSSDHQDDGIVKGNHMLLSKDLVELSSTRSFLIVPHRSIRDMFYIRMSLIDL